MEPVKKSYIKAYKFRIYPTKKQQIFLAKQFGCCRFVYNYCLDLHNRVYKEEHRSLSKKEMNAQLPILKKQKQTEWLGEVIAQPLQMAVHDLDTAFQRFFKKKSAYPKFKSRHDRQCFKIPQNAKLEGGLLKIPKLDSLIKVNLSRAVIGKILYVHISKTATGKYYASFTCAGEREVFEKTGKQIGIDLGIKEAATLSDGTTFDNKKAFRTLEKKLVFTQRQLSKKQKGGKSRQRLRRRVALIHEKIKNVRHDHNNKMTTQVIKSHDLLAVEDLGVTNMLKNHKLAKSIADVSMGTILKQLKYKSEWHNRDYIEVDRFFASSKLCSSCGYKKEDLSLKDRSWTCPSCLTAHDRDINAAKNILAEGLRKKSGCGTQSD